jgi:hypothetical protein
MSLLNSLILLSEQAPIIVWKQVYNPSQGATQDTKHPNRQYLRPFMNDYPPFDQSPILHSIQSGAHTCQQQEQQYRLANACPSTLHQQSTKHEQLHAPCE